SGGRAPEPLDRHRNERHQPQRDKPSNQLRRHKRPRIERVWARLLASRSHLGKAGLVRRLLGLDYAVEPTSGQRIRKSSWNNADYSGDDIGSETHAQQSRGQVDEPKRKNRDEAQKEEVVEGILLESPAK